MYIRVNMSELPVRLCFDHPVSDAELMKFSHENEVLRVEREPNGELMLMSPSGLDGGWIETEVGIELGLWARTNALGTTMGPSAGFTLKNSAVRAADASWISWARFNSVTKEQREGYAPICPEFIIEVRSKTDRLKPLQEKMRMWLANGAELAWLIDPQRKVVEVYRLNEEPELHQNPTSVQGSGPVAGFELVLSRIWG